MKDLVGQQFGNYRLTKRLGHSNFADIYQSEHVHHKTQAAVEILNLSMTSRDQQKFLEEAQTVTTLKHHNIAEVLEFGIDKNSSIPFVVMEYVPGGTLAQRHPHGVILPIATVLPYVKQIAAALQYAHDRGIVHGDINPRNILTGPDNTLLLSNFDIAAVLPTIPSPGTQGSVEVNHYRAPEQIRGSAIPASDQYALAVMIYEWLCGAYPFEGATSAEVEEKQLSHDFPPSMRDRVPAIPIRVEQAVFKALAKDPLKRYKKEQAQVNAIEYASLEYAGPLMGRKLAPVPATPKPPLGQIRRAYAGHAKAVSDVAWSPDGGRIASTGLDRTVQIWIADNADPLHTYKISYSPDQSTSSTENLLYAVTWSPDAKLLALSDVFGIVIIDSETGYPLQTIETMSGSLFLHLASISNSLAQIVQWGNIKTSNAGSYNYSSTSAPLKVWSMQRETIPSVTWSPDGRHIAFTDGNTVRVWDVLKGHLVFSYRGHNAQYTIATVAWSPDGKLIASSDVAAVYIWQASNGELDVKIAMDAVANISWAPDMKRLACSSTAYKCTKIWDIKQQKECIKYSELLSAKWSPDGMHIALIGSPNKVDVYDVTAEKVSVTYNGHLDRVSAIVWAPDNSRIASASIDGTVRIWQAT